MRDALLTLVRLATAISLPAPRPTGRVGEMVRVTVLMMAQPANGAQVLLKPLVPNSQNSRRL